MPHKFVILCAVIHSLAEDVGAFTRPSAQRNSVWRRSKRHLRVFMNRYVSCPINRNSGKLVQVYAFCYEKPMNSRNTMEVLYYYVLSK